MLQNYELYLILSPDLDTNQNQLELDLIQKILESDLNATNIALESEGLKKMAYPIHKNWTGFYASFSFDMDITDTPKISTLEKKINLREKVYRYLLLNQTEFFVQKEKEVEGSEKEFANHRDLNKGQKDKKCMFRYLGVKTIDFRNVEFLDQFTSPYCKIFSREKTGTSAKYQRKVNIAIKRARHMALMPFTPKHFG